MEDSTKEGAYVARERSSTHPMHRKATRLYTRAQMASLLGCSVSTYDRLRRQFLSKRQQAYLLAVGYNAAYYPQRKGKG